MQITTIGLDTAKQVFHVVGLDARGQVVLKKRLRRRQVLRFFATIQPTVVGLEACGGSHYWGRELRGLGQEVKLIPAQHVKPLVQGQKNDYNDALAIAEALNRPKLRCVAVKSLQEQDAQALHRLRQGLMKERTALCNRIRGLLAEYGIVLPKGVAVLRRHLPELLEAADNGLSDAFRALLAHAGEHLRHLDDQLAHLDKQLKLELKQDPQAKRLLAIPGFGPILSSVWRARIGRGQAFRRGREVSAALGIVPRQHSTGGKAQLLGITKKGDGYLRCLLVHGARAVVTHAHKHNDPLHRWVSAVKARRGSAIATVALANKMARIAWAVSYHDTDYQAKRAA